MVFPFKLSFQGYFPLPRFVAKGTVPVCICFSNLRCWNNLAFSPMYIYICIYLYTYISLFICIWTKDGDTSEERRFICFHRGVMLFDLLKDTGTTRWLHEFWLSRSCDIFYLVISFVLFLWIRKSVVVMTPWLQTTLPSGKRLHNYGKSPWEKPLFLWPWSIAMFDITRG